MPKPNPALLPRPALFDVTIAKKSPINRRIERIPLEQMEARRQRATRDPARKGSNGSQRCCAAPAS